MPLTAKQRQMLSPYGSPTCVKFRERIIGPMRALRQPVINRYISIADDQGYVAANRWLGKLGERVKLADGALTIFNDDEDIRSYSESLSRALERLIRENGGYRDNRAVCQKVRRLLIKKRIISDDCNWSDTSGQLKRAIDPKWIGERLKKTARREYENYARMFGLVARCKGKYVSDATFKRVLGGKYRCRMLLEQLRAVSDQGDDISLADAVDSSVANPELARNELLARITGFERLADSFDVPLQGEFLTITCPSKYHAAYNDGSPNPKYKDFTAREANDYLCKQWARARSALDRAGIQPFGFRVAEPHCDGTPHWHLLFFVPVEQAEEMCSIIKRYAFQQDGDETGAEKYRFKRETIDKSKGSAASYVIKYISKNIDGFGVDDIDGEPGNVGALRIRAWASVNGIRQFQQYGGAQVTIWRELRRLAPDSVCDEKLKAIAVACDNGDWASYNELMGGIHAKRAERPVVLYKEKAPKNNRYGEPYEIIKGVTMCGAQELTRPKMWEVRFASDTPAANDPNAAA